MRREDFTYELPNELIARHPAKERRESRLLCVDGPSGALSHEAFVGLLDKVRAGDLMVFNDTRVIPARVFGRKASGGKIEILVERVLSAYQVLAHVKASKAPKPGTHLVLENGTEVEVDSRRDALFVLNFLGEQEVIDVLEAVGHMPLPPYIDREDELEDQSRYQTVYADKKGAVAAPTAGLHFDDAMLEALKEKGVQVGFVTLHVGAGTFQPVRVDDIKQHQMHSEVINVDQSLCDAVLETRARGGRVIAVGTTSVRCLESISSVGEHGELKVEPYVGETDIFIYPGYEFKLVDCLITNFHLPESTLLMLVSAFIGYEATMQAYNVAVAQKYRFFSYGDAMYLSRNPDAANQGPHSET